MSSYVTLQLYTRTRAARIKIPGIEPPGLLPSVSYSAVAMVVWQSHRTITRTPLLLESCEPDWRGVDHKCRYSVLQTEVHVYESIIPRKPSRPVLHPTAALRPHISAVPWFETGYLQDARHAHAGSRAPWLLSGGLEGGVVRKTYCQRRPLLLRMLLRRRYDSPPDFFIQHAEESIWIPSRKPGGSVILYVLLRACAQLGLARLVWLMGSGGVSMYTLLVRKDGDKEDIHAIYKSVQKLPRG